MKSVLFVCKSNTGRSKMAAAFLRRIRPELHVIDAGSKVGKRAGTIIHDYVIQVMEELDFDFSKQTRIQLSPKHVQKADKIIVMDEKENLPNYLLDSGKIVFWDVEDAAGTDLQFHRKTRDKIKNLIKKNF